MISCGIAVMLPLQFPALFSVKFVSPFILRTALTFLQDNMRDNKGPKRPHSRDPGWIAGHAEFADTEHFLSQSNIFVEGRKLIVDRADKTVVYGFRNVSARKSTLARRVVFSHDVDAIGSQMNAFTGREATCYYIKTLSSNLDKSLEILLDMFTSSVFDENEMDRERKVIFEEMKMIRDTPDEDCQDTITEQVFRGTPLGSSIIGTESTLNGIHRSTIKNYISREYTRDSIVVAFAGNFDERHGRIYFDKKLIISVLQHFRCHNCI